MENAIQKIKDKKLIGLIIISFMLLICCACSLISSLSDNTVEEAENTNRDNFQEEEYVAPTEEIIVVEPTEIIITNTPEPTIEAVPTWYGKEYKITTIESQPGMEDYDVRIINVWPSFEDRSKVLFTLSNNEAITLIGYNSDSDYCEIRRSSQEGWIACVWIVGLPTPMTDYWKS